MPIIKVIAGSTRPNRFSRTVADWVMSLSEEHPEASYELIDLRDIDLPFLDEPLPPLAGAYANEHTKSWAKLIGPADGFIFVTPEYNHGVPAVFKNAVDFLAAEWQYKPVAFVGYGVQGGARAIEQWRSIVANLSMFDLRDHVAIRHFEQQDENGAFIPSAMQTATAHDLLKNIAFWAGQLAPARSLLAQNP